ncbi:MAG: hypothetical protein ACM3RP_10750 [Chitinophagales bacterium]
MKHIETAPQLFVAKLDKAYDEVADGYGNLIKTSGKGATAVLTNEGAGVASHVTVDVVDCSGQPLPVEPTWFEYVPPGRGCTFSFAWNPEEQDVSGTIHLTYRGPLGAKYQKEYGFRTTSEMPFVELEHHADRDRAKYPDDI